MLQTVDIEASVADFPPGVRMTPAQFFEWFVENITFRASGDFLAGQIDGARPLTNVGMYVHDRMIELWDGAKYASLLTPPIGVMTPWPSGLLVPPDDYLFCDGQLVLKTDFPLLYNVITDVWKATGDDPAFFRLPSTAGRVMVGAGDGDYNPTKLPSAANGNITKHNIGEYFGAEWAVRTLAQANAPTVRYFLGPAGNTPFPGRTFTGVMQPAFVCKWIIRAK